MTSDTKIGNVTKLILNTTDTLGNKVETTLNTNFKVNANATYSNVYTGFQALVAMIKNTYADVINVTNVSTNEAMAG